jgi:hypothetical protein
MAPFKWIVLLDHPVTGDPTPIATLMADTRIQAERRAHALYTAAAWVQSEASNAVDRGRTEKLLARFRASDRRWKHHRFEDEDDD